MVTHAGGSAEIEAAKARLLTAKQFAKWSSSQLRAAYASVEAADANVKAAKDALKTAQKALTDVRNAHTSAAKEVADAEESVKAAEEKWGLIELDIDEEEAVDGASVAVSTRNKRGAGAISPEQVETEQRTTSKKSKNLIFNDVQAVEVMGCDASGKYERVVNRLWNGAPYFYRQGCYEGKMGGFGLARSPHGRWFIFFRFNSGHAENKFLYQTKKTGEIQLDPIEEEWELDSHGTLPRPTLKILDRDNQRLRDH